MDWCCTGRGKGKEQWNGSGKTLLHLWWESRHLCTPVPGWVKWTVIKHICEVEIITCQIMLFYCNRKWEFRVGGVIYWRTRGVRVLKAASGFAIRLISWWVEAFFGRHSHLGPVCSTVPFSKLCHWMPAVINCCNLLIGFLHHNHACICR